MSQKIKYLYDNKEIAEILSQGFAKICQQKPKFPINYLARFLKNHTSKNQQKSLLIDKLEHNEELIKYIQKRQQEVQYCQSQVDQKQKVLRMERDNFLLKISQAQRHEQILDYFCEWVQDRLKLGGVYIGQLQNQVKKINLAEEDREQAHLELDKEKIVRFKYASENHKRIVVGKTLTQESVVGKLLNQPQGEQTPAEQQSPEGTQAEKKAIKGQTYIGSVVGNQQLKFFRFPKLGSYFASTLSIKSYLKERLFDENTAKVQSYRKILHDFEKQIEQKQAKFKQQYDEKVNGGAEQRQLEEMQKQFERQKSEIKRPVQQDFTFHERKFVLCFDTLGLDREITEQEKQQIRYFISHLKTSWQSQQKQQLSKDIDLQLSLFKPHINEEGHQQQAPNYLQQLNNLIEQEEKQIPTHEQVQKVKDNQKLLELESNTVRLEKTKEYMTQEKYLKFWDHMLELNVVKYPQVLKQFLILLSYRKEDFCVRGTNVLDWQKTKGLLKTHRQRIFELLSAVNPRGSKPEIVHPYAKCARIAKNIEGLELQTLSTYNIYFSFMLRLLQLYTKTRQQDREARLAKIQLQRQNREQKLKEAEEKAAEKKEKLDTLKAELEQKGQLQTFDETVWNLQYDEQNPPIEIPEEVPMDIDRDLQDLAQGENKADEQKGDQ